VIVGEDTKKLLNYLVQNEIYDLDTAYIYGFGSSEEEIGRVLPQMSIPREKWTIATKANRSVGSTSQAV